jgi:hypothetical protein
MSLPSVGITPQRPRFDTVRAAVRLALRTHICGLVPATNVNWLADVRSKVSEVRSKVSFTLSARL